MAQAGHPHTEENAMSDVVTDLTDEDIRTELAATQPTAEADDDGTDPADGADADDDGSDADDDGSDGGDADGTDA
jgi:hypothetical protein